MRIYKNERGNSVLSLICGLAGVLVGAFLVFILFYTNGINVTPEVSHESPTPKVEKSQEESSRTADSTSIVGEAKINYNAKSSGLLPQGSSAVADAVSKVAPAVVNIDTTVTAKRYHQDGFGFIDPFDYQEQEVPQGMGTGMIVSADGLVLTNNHVVRGTHSIHVTLADNTKHDATIVGTDPISDLAVLRIDNPDGIKFPTVTLTNSENMRIGDWVIALGNPLGVGQTATVGILSARNRNLSDINVVLRNLLQTDAAINPGNSGGPLLNMNGEVVGINTAIIRSAQGIGFAIPAETAHSVMQELVTNGRVSRPYLGIEMGVLTDDARNFLNVSKKINGVIVGRVVKNGPAHKAGIKGYDIIMDINGTPTKNPQELQDYVRSLKVGTKVSIKFWRQGREHKVDVTLTEMPDAMSRRQ
ncbi:MAG: trypsin-like peptidase domain-containing protein [bacterium]|nr:trypsin-like peptidase domain-containing protein [bacterium]